jgi:hypothetical protein
MAQAAPLFARHPAPHDPPYLPRQGLDAGAGFTWAATAPGSEAGPGDDAIPARMERRGARIVAALQARARAEGREPLGPDELRTVLENLTNLPADIIGRLAGRPSARRVTDLVPVAAGATRTARPWELDFPMTVREVVATGAQAGPGSGIRPAIQSRSAGRSVRPGGPGHAG